MTGWKWGRPAHWGTVKEDQVWGGMTLGAEIPQKQLKIELGPGPPRRMLSDAVWRPNERDLQVFV